MSGWRLKWRERGYCYYQSYKSIGRTLANRHYKPTDTGLDVTREKTEQHSKKEQSQENQDRW